MVKFDHLYCVIRLIDLDLFFEKSLSEVFVRIKLHKKYIYFFLKLRKLTRIRGQICSAALVIDNFVCQILLCTNAVLQNQPLQIKKSRSFFCVQFYAIKNF